jgi:hypothetical protein
MHAKVRCLVLVLACLIVPSALVAQQGHPLAGIWSGDWGPNANDRNPVTIELNWVTTTLSGTINPGLPDAAQVRAGTLNSKNWTVHIEAEGKDEAGNPVRIVMDGKIDNLGSANRTLTGTWTRNNTRNTFKLTRE